MASHGLLSPRWYERENALYLADREKVEQYAAFVKLVPWKLYGTFTFAWRVTDAQAENTFAEFINRLERHLKSDVGYVRGAEKRVSGCGKPASGRHFHALLTSPTNVEPLLVEALWTSIAATEYSGAHVEPYNNTGNAASYVLKLMHHPDGEWSHRKLHLFHPDANNQHLNARRRRTLQRHQARVKASAHSEAPKLTPGGLTPAAPPMMFGQQLDWGSLL
jgi:hypothetical protein